MRRIAVSGFVLLLAGLSLPACGGPGEPVALVEVVGSASPNYVAGAGRFASERYGFSTLVPAGWRRAKERLVPRLLNPREVLSLGTFTMPVGGGGNCGREPAAAIDRMKPGDALLSIQEYASTDATPAPPLPGGLASELSWRSRLDLRRGRMPAGGNLWSATLSFGDRARWFDALIYVKGEPQPAQLRDIRSILDGLRFSAPRRR